MVMPRMPRLDGPGFLHHIMVRGIEKALIFRKSRDYHIFRDRLGLVLGQCSNICLAWALMPNHIHLLVQSGVEGLAWMMRRVLTSYAVRFNLRYKRVGHVFQNRYKSIICQEDPYFLQLIRYIHLNPLVGGLVSDMKTLANYPWTGHRALMGNVALPWQATTPVLTRWGNDVQAARIRYEQFVTDGIKEGYRDDLEGEGLPSVTKMLHGSDDDEYEITTDQRILGNSAFIENVLRQTELNEKFNRELKNKRVTLSTVLATAASFQGISTDIVVTGNKAKPAADARAMTIYTGATHLRLTGQDMAEQLHISPSAVSRAFLRGRDLVAQSDFLKRLEI